MIIALLGLRKPAVDKERKVFGFLLQQWPTILILLMFSLLAWMYTRLAKSEERELLAGFGEAYARYADATPAFLPQMWCALKEEKR